MAGSRIRFGLWVRMALASAFLFVSLVVAVAAELLLVGGVATVGHYVAVYVSWLILSPFPLAAFAVGFLAYVCLLWFLYLESRTSPDADDDAVDGETATREAIGAAMRAHLDSVRDRLGPAGSALAVGAVVVAFGASLLLGERFGELAYYAFLPALVALYVVGTQLRATVRSELAGDAAVLRSIDGSLPRIADADRHPELIDLRRRVRRLAQQADVAPPSVELAVERTPVALTVGYRPAESTIVVSKGLVADLEERELEAVLAHELAHVANRDAALMSAMSVPSVKAEQLTENHTSGYVQLLGFFLQGCCRWWLCLVARHREYVADEGAVAITGDSAALASALRSLDRSLERRPRTDLREHRSAAAFSIVPPPREEHRFFDRLRRFADRRLFGTHPPTAKRIERLRDRI